MAANTHGISISVMAVGSLDDIIAAVGKPYFRDDAVVIYNADCRSILPKIPQVDLVLTDPPYVGLTGTGPIVKGGVGPHYRESRLVGDRWDADLDWVGQIKPLSGLGCFIFTSYHALPEVALAMAPLRRAVLLTWHKRNAPPSHKNVPRFTEEYIWGFAAKVGLRWDVFKSTMIDEPKLAAGCMATERLVDKEGVALHPTQKPLAVIKWLLQVGGQTILDPFMGSGTTLRAAKDLGRLAVGIEINEAYCEIAARRMQQSVLDLGTWDNKGTARAVGDGSQTVMPIEIPNIVPTPAISQSDGETKGSA